MRRRDGLGDRERERERKRRGREERWRCNGGGDDVGKWRRGGGMEE